MTFIAAHEGPKPELPAGFYYISQDNYDIVHLDAPDPNHAKRYLYSDGATSCIILIVEGQDASHHPLMAFSHLSSHERFLHFFEIINANFCGAVSVFALGATPLWAEASGQNINTVLDWIAAHTSKPSSLHPATAGWHLEQMTLAFGKGRPQEGNSGCCGIDVETLTVSDQSYHVTAAQRDPTGGVQSLFGMFGLTVDPPMRLHRADEEFSQEQIAQLVKQARRHNWPQILALPEEHVLQMCSSTPQHEVPWFYETLRKSAQYVETSAA